MKQREKDKGKKELMKERKEVSRENTSKNENETMTSYLSKVQCISK